MVHRLPLEKGLPEIHRLSLPYPSLQRTNRIAAFLHQNGGRGIILHAFGFLELPTCPSKPPPLLSLLSSTEPFQLWKQPKDSGGTSYIAIQDCWYCLAVPIACGKPPVQLHSVKRKGDLSCNFYVGFSVATFYVL